MRLRDLVDIVHDVRALRLQVAAGQSGAPRARTAARHRSLTMLLPRSRDGAALGNLCRTGHRSCVRLLDRHGVAARWRRGHLYRGGMQLLCRPGRSAPAILQFLRYVLISAVIGAAYLFADPAAVTSFDMLARHFRRFSCFLGTDRHAGDELPRDGHRRECRGNAYAFQRLQCRFRNLREQRDRHRGRHGGRCHADPHLPAGWRSLQRTPFDARQPPRYCPRALGESPSIARR